MISLVIFSLTDNMKKVTHLLELPKASTHLTLWKADLSVEGSYDEAIQGCTGVFHVATPMDFESKDPEVYMISNFTSFENANSFSAKGDYPAYERLELISSTISFAGKMSIAGSLSMFWTIVFCFIKLISW
jgi:hypothetical protein